MNYTDILIYMRHEVTLMAIIIVLFIYDLAAGASRPLPAVC